MCYTIEINLTREQLEKRFQAKLDQHLPYQKQLRLSAFSLPLCPVIRSDEPSKILLNTWGLIPRWIKSEESAKEIRSKTFNAKCETISEKASFRHLVKANRCLVLIDGFYEWQHRGREKQPYFISLKNAEAFALAGLFDSWTNTATGELLDTFTIITTQANPLMERIHNTQKRMPVILDKANEQTWIDLSANHEKSIKLLRPFDENKMVAVEIDKGQFGQKEKGRPVQPTLF